MIEEERPERVRVTRLDSNREEVIRNPIVANDSIATTERGCQEDVERRAQTCTITPVMLLSEVASLDVGRQSGFLTGIAVMMGVFFAAAMIGSAAVKPF